MKAKILSFIKGVLSDENQPSSKRTLSFLFAFVLVGVIVAKLSGIDKADTLIWPVISLIGGLQGLTMIPKV